MVRLSLLIVAMRGVPCAIVIRHLPSQKKRLLYVSSSEVYGNKTGNQPYKEKDYGYVDILNQRACYPSAKRAAETLCTAYGQEYGLDTVIVRPGHIYGPTITETDSRASAQFTQNAIEGEDIVMKSAGMQMRSYCYVLDCAYPILAYVKIIRNRKKQIFGKRISGTTNCGRIL